MIVTPNGRQASFIQRILNKILDPIEIITLIGTGVGLAFQYLHLPGGAEMIMIFMSLLAGVYFLSAYRVVTPNENEAAGSFIDLLATSIASKVAWIGMAVAIDGCLFKILHLNGADEMILVGCGALIVTIAIMALYLVTSAERGRVLTRVLYRAVPVCLFGIYLFLNKPA